MSLFLGKIHYWLYNKILWFERIEEDLIQWAKTEELPVEEWKKQGIQKYGSPTGGRPLEEIIDTSNIHGWLQAQIESAELRQAALVTAILKENPGFKESLTEIFKKQGEAAAREYDNIPDTPEDVYSALNDFILEGMPCDRVNEVVSSDDEEFVWQTTECLHKPYWDQVRGDVGNFYDLREAWVKAFVETMNPQFSYEKSADGMHSIAVR